jgi:hypothetical protein
MIGIYEETMDQNDWLPVYWTIYLVSDLLIGTPFVDLIREASRRGYFGRDDRGCVGISGRDHNEEQ